MPVYFQDDDALAELLGYGPPSADPVRTLPMPTGPMPADLGAFTRAPVGDAADPGPLPLYLKSAGMPKARPELPEASPSDPYAPPPGPVPTLSQPGLPREPAGVPGRAGGAHAMQSPAPQRITLPQPPMAQPRDDTAALTFAAFLDLLLNKGRNMGLLIGGAMQPGPDVAHENWRRQMDHATAEAKLNRPAQRSDPEMLELRRRRLDLMQDREQRISGTQGYKLDRLKQEQDPQSGISDRLRARIYEYNPELAGRFDGASYEEMTQNPDVKRMLQEQHEDRRRGKEFQDYRSRKGVETAHAKVRAEHGDVIAQRRERRAELRVQSAEDRNFASKFNAKHGTDLDIAGLVQDVERLGGNAPEGLAERLGGNWLMQRGIDPDRIEAWQSKQMVLELWARGQTGAAISESEDERFAVQNGLGTAASREQIEAAYTVMERIIKRRLRRASVGHEDAARSVGEAGELDTPRWFGGPGAARPRQRQAAPPGDEDDIPGVMFK